jgi:tripartite-type tricarboxylate transporter receptor subunit TctC
MARFIVAALSAVVLALSIATPVAAQTYPAKPIRLIVPFPPGGGTDSVSRVVAQELQKSTGWTVVVENKAGAGGMIGLQEAARARTTATAS